MMCRYLAGPAKGTGNTMKRTLCAALLAASSAVAHAQQLPNDVDLLAAYCAPIVNQQVAVFQSGQSGQPLPPHAEQYLKDAAADAQQRSGRLKRYLMPRIPYLDPTALAAASTQGKEDVERAQQDAAQCISTCEHDANPPQCARSCTTDTLTRVRRCTARVVAILGARLPLTSARRWSRRIPGS